MVLPEAITGGVTTGHNAHHIELHTWLNDQTVFQVPAGGTEADIANALADAHAAGGGVVELLGPSYTASGNPAFSITKPTVSLRAQGSTTTVISYTGVGDCFRITTNPFTVDQAGYLKGVSIHGSTAGANAVGVHMGDIVGFELDDVVIYGFDGAAGVGLWLDNVTGWTERCRTSRVWLGDNRVGLLFTVQATGNISFGYNQFTGLLLNVHSGQFGFVSRDSALVYGGSFEAILNVESGGQVGLVEDGSFWWRERVQIHGELMAGTGVGITTASGATFNPTGDINLPGLPSSNANAESVASKHRIRGANIAQVSGNYSDKNGAVKANFLGSGITADILPSSMVDEDSPYAMFGFLHGSTIDSPFVCMYDGASNAFVIYRRGFGVLASAMVELFRVDSGGHVFMVSTSPPPPPATGTATYATTGVFATTGCLKTGTDITANRPSAVTAGFGAQWFDATLQKPIWSNGTVWKDAMGNVV